jgi:hypothetical protein
VADRIEAGERAVEQLARGAPLHVGDEADATCVALASGVVEEALLVAHCAGHLSDGKEGESPADASELVRRRREG